MAILTMCSYILTSLLVSLMILWCVSYVRLGKSVDIFVLQNGHLQTAPLLLNGNTA